MPPVGDPALLADTCDTDIDMALGGAHCSLHPFLLFDSLVFQAPITIHLF